MQGDGSPAPVGAWDEALATASAESIVSLVESVRGGAAARIRLVLAGSAGDATRTLTSLRRALAGTVPFVAVPPGSEPLAAAAAAVARDLCRRGAGARPQLAALVDRLVAIAGPFVLHDDFAAASAELAPGSLDAATVLPEVLRSRLLPELATVVPGISAELLRTLASERVRAGDGTALAGIAARLGAKDFLRQLGTLASRLEVPVVVVFEPSESCAVVAAAAAELVRDGGYRVVVGASQGVWEGQRALLHEEERALFDPVALASPAAPAAPGALAGPAPASPPAPAVPAAPAPTSPSPPEPRPAPAASSAPAAPGPVPASASPAAPARRDSARVSPPPLASSTPSPPRRAGGRRAPSSATLAALGLGAAGALVIVGSVVWKPTLLEPLVGPRTSPSATPTAAVDSLVPVSSPGTGGHASPGPSSPGRATPSPQPSAEPSDPYERALAHANTAVEKLRVVDRARAELPPERALAVIDHLLAEVANHEGAAALRSALVTRLQLIDLPESAERLMELAEATLSPPDERIAALKAVASRRQFLNDRIRVRLERLAATSPDDGVRAGARTALGS